VTYDPERNAIDLPGVGEIDVAGLHRDLGGAPDGQRAQMLAKVASMLAQPKPVPTTWAEARDKVLPIVVRSMDLAAAELRAGAAGRPYPRYAAAITDHVVFQLGIPLEHGTAHVPAETVQAWGIDGNEIFRQAGRNLEARSAGAWRTAREAPGVFVGPWRDGHAASRLFLPRVFANLPLRGRPVVLVPAPHLLLAADSSEEESVFQLALFARRIVEREKRIFLLRALRMGEDGESWEDWLPPPGHAAHAPLRLLRAMEERMDYDAHAALVAEIAGGRDTVVLPPLEIGQSSLGADVLTVTRWSAGTPHALPKADAVVLVRDGTTLGFVAWDHLVETLPDALSLVPGYPPRYIASSFPEDWQLGGLELSPWQDPRPPE
jgi:hypothetical protein